MRALSTELRRGLERSVLAGRRAAELGVRAALGSLGVQARDKPSYLSEEQARLRRGLRAKQRQLGGGFELLVWECAYEQWHRLLFARYLAENGLLRHPVYEAPVTLAECEELAEELGEPDGWSVAARFAAEILPGIFRLDDPAVQVRLAAEHRVALEQIVGGLPSEVFLADDSLGWVYQYWQSERKDQVNASEAKIGGADLAPVTQLFTENYMVRFLLENSLGAWWVARHPGSPLVKEFEFLRFDGDGQPATGRFDEWPVTVAEVTVMDPCCGSGHFLVEAFALLWRMRAEEEGLDPVAAQDAVLADNLFGLELDPRCVQIAMFAVALAAWKQGGWRRLPTPNIACSGIPAKAPLEEWTALAEGDERLERALERLHRLFKDADTLGSLIDPRRAAAMANAAGAQQSFDDVDFHEVAPLLEKAAASETDDPATAVLGADAAGIARAASLLARSYALVATNPPFLLQRKQNEALVSYMSDRYPESGGNSATAFILRGMDFASDKMGSVSMVLPENWIYLKSYEQLRRHLLSSFECKVVVRLGSGAFSAELHPGARFSLLVASRSRPDARSELVLSKIEKGGTPAEKDKELRGCRLSTTRQQDHLESPEARILSVPLAGKTLLGDIAHAYKGLTTGDDARWKRYHWEFGTIGRWHRMQTSFSTVSNVAGCLYVIDFERMTSPSLNLGVELRGEDTWGRPGVAVSQVGLAVARSVGAKFDQNVAVLLPDEGRNLIALLCFCRSDEYRMLVRELDESLKVTNATLVRVPFDLERWRAVAAEEFPEGLPAPRSNDPTQWLFEGRPEVATEPLQVGVGRLVGYRWPEQSEDDGLEVHADADGIVCLPAVRGEPPAADRLSALLVDAYGGEWSSGLTARLLGEAGSKKKTMSDWLRDDFFKHHCKVFSNRPFVWHIWDGRNDGFAALVNYHRLDRAGLEKLTYTYLGDWIERQRAAAAEGVAGADLRLAAALELRGKLEAILEGEPPFDIYVRWKPLAQQPIGWDPDLDDGVRLNIRPFVEAGVLRSKVNVHWKKDRGKNTDGSERHNDLHYTNDQKRRARQEAGTA